MTRATLLFCLVVSCLWALAAATGGCGSESAETGTAYDSGPEADSGPAADAGVADQGGDEEADLGRDPDLGGGPDLGQDPDTGPVELVHAPYDPPELFRSSAPWVGTRWLEFARAQELVRIDAAEDFRVESGFVVDEWGQLALDPAEHSAHAVAGPLFLSAGRNRVLTVRQQLGGHDGPVLTLECDGVAVARHEVQVEERWWNPELPEELSGSCVVRFDAEREPGAPAPEWVLGRLEINQWLGLIDWAPLPASGDVPTLLAWQGGLASATGGPLAIARSGRGESWVASTRLAGAPEGAAPLTWLLDDGVPQLVVADAGSGLHVARLDAAANELAGWAPLGVSGVRAAFAAQAPAGAALAVESPDAGVLVLPWGGDAVEAEEPLAVAAAGARLERMVSAEGALLVAASVGDERWLYLLRCATEACDEMAVAASWTLPAGSGPPDLLGVGSRFHLAWQRADDAHIVVAEVDAAAEVDAPGEPLAGTETPLEGHTPRLGFWGTALLLAYLDEDGALRFAYEPRTGHDGGWQGGALVDPSGEALALVEGSLTKLQRGESLLLAARAQDGGWLLRDLSLAISREVALAEGFEVGLDEASRSAEDPLLTPEAYAPHDLPAYANVAPAIWAWPRPLLEATFGGERQEPWWIGLCNGEACFQCGGASGCMVTGGVEVPRSAKLELVYHELGHWVAPRMLQNSSAAGEPLYDAATSEELRAAFAQPGDCADRWDVPYVPTYWFGDALHYAGFSPAGRYYDCGFFGYPDHYLINLITYYVTHGYHLRALVHADLVSEVEGMDPWRTLLRDKYEWVREHLFAGVEYRYDGVPCSVPERCAEDQGAVGR